VTVCRISICYRLVNLQKIYIKINFLKSQVSVTICKVYLTLLGEPYKVKHALHNIKEYRHMNTSSLDNTNRNNRLKHSTHKIGAWTSIWLLSTAIATFGPMFIWDYNITVSLIAIVINALIGIAIIKVNIQHLRSLDELQQKIALEAMALALGVGIIFGLVYSLLDTTKVIAHAEISHLIILMGLTYGIGIFLGNRRYK